MKTYIATLALAAALTASPCATADPGPDWTGDTDCETNVMGATGWCAGNPCI
ncbi:hypothetical protein PP713_01635 [Mycobacterium sp. CSUR Q5927]|nr:hypothetical protein [Mycobacterium sp. CSUR Q5927]